MFPCCRGNDLSNKIAPAESRRRLLWDTVSETNTMTTNLESSVASSCTTSVSVFPQQLTTTTNDYRILQSIGVGFFGSANILLVHHKSSNFIGVAREIDLESLSFEQLQEIQTELLTARSLDHSNVISYCFSFVSDTKLWTLQQLMHYGSCADILHSVKQFNNGFHESIISIILRDVIKATDYLHTLGYVHRSIRAKHFLIDENGIVKLSGLRSMVSLIQEGKRHKRVHGHFKGTSENICWLAPEVLAQDTGGYSFQSDIYSIGIAALELATGEAPFAGLPLTEIMMLKLKGHPPMLLKRQDNDDPMKNFTKTFFKVVNLCVNPDPFQRPSSSKLLTLSFIKTKKKTSNLSLKELLLPVVPLDTSQLDTCSNDLAANIGSLSIATSSH